MDYFQQLLSEVTLLSPSMGAIFAGIVACLLLFVSGFASGSEIAFFSLSPADLNDLDETKTDADAQIQQLREESERTLATILITNNLVNVTIIMVVGIPVYNGLADVPAVALWRNHAKGLCRSLSVALLSGCCWRHYVLS